MHFHIMVFVYTYVIQSLKCYTFGCTYLLFKHFERHIRYNSSWLNCIPIIIPTNPVYYSICTEKHEKLNLKPLKTYKY